MKNILKFVLILLAITIVSGCTSNAIKFKNDYESLNGKTNANGKEYRTITIDKDNPFVYTNLKKINNYIV